MNVKLLKVLEDLYEIRANLERKRFSTVQRRSIDRVIRAIQDMLLAGNSPVKPCASFWHYVRGAINVGLVVKAFIWITRIIQSFTGSE